MLVQITEMDSNTTSRHLKITNMSANYIKNIELSLYSPNSIIVEQMIVRERGALKFPPTTDSIPIGNLSPEETAHFYYSFKPLTHLSPISDNITLSYVEENEAAHSNLFSTTPLEPGPTLD